MIRAKIVLIELEKIRITMKETSSAKMKVLNIK